MSTVAESLAKKRIITSPRLFRIYAGIMRRDRKLKPGTYLIRRGRSWPALLDDLVLGRGLVYAVTIPEGWEISTMIPAIVDAVHVSAESLRSAVRDTALLRRLEIPTSTLEGYLFPETYVFADGATAREVVRFMVREFERRWKPGWDTRLSTLKMTRHQVVTLASIIEKEAKLPRERAVISAVYHNRLRLRMPLQADPTVQFALGKHRERVLYKDLEVDSRYNTYRTSGLPPGPIASPGASSIEAALFPADVPYLYFVAHPDGHHEFRRTYREHSIAVRQIRVQREEQEQAARRP
jgi:UPF0755 protein